MKDTTRNSKQAAKHFNDILSTAPGLFDLLAIREHGKVAFDDLHKRLGAMLVESIVHRRSTPSGFGEVLVIIWSIWIFTGKQIFG
jgi:hypothetical protein